MTTLFERFPELGRQAEADTYLPFFPAVEMGKLTDPQLLAAQPKNPLGVDLANGVIPNARNKGIIALGEQIVGVDHVGIQKWGRQYIINPTAKTDVKPKGHFAAEGAVAMSTVEGRLKLIGVVVDIIHHPWRFAFPRRHTMQRPLGDLAVILTGIEAPELEVKSVLDSGHQIAIPRQRVF